MEHQWPKMTATVEQQRQNSQLFIENAPYVEQMYQLFLQAPDSLPTAWLQYFQQLEAAQDLAAFQPPTFERPAREPLQQVLQSSCSHHKQGAVFRLINAYRVRGHQVADLDPIQLYPRAEVADLELDWHHLDQHDMETEFDTGSLVAPDKMKLRDILQLLQQTYTSTIGYEYMHITDTLQKRWIQQQIEGHRPQCSKAESLAIMERLTAAEGLERYLHTKYVGQKRFSLEGGEALIPLLDKLIQESVNHQVEEIVIGMAHRGRLNVLINILGKSPALLFREFEGENESDHAGDVKYHKGFSTDLMINDKLLHLVLAFNPSHLEIVNPVVQGSVRARQQRYGDLTGNRVIPVIIHGDSAFAGQGVVMETLQMSQSRGFTTGGTLHVVVNNQIGFTTSNPLDTRSTLYATDVSKMVQAPVFHVNGDDPEAVLHVVRLALAFRQTFNKDVVIDMVCYRRHGHNEADEPACTQPMMYKKIRQHQTLTEIYARKLQEKNMLSEQTLASMKQSYRLSLEKEEIVAKHIVGQKVDNPYLVNWKPYLQQNWQEAVETGVECEKLLQLSSRLQQLPAGFELHPRVKKIIDDRGKMAQGAMPFNWGGAEILAYATILDQGFEIRISGQDSGRGTFFHRHCVLHNQINGDMYTPLQHLFKHQPHFLIIDSLLSEEAVLAYEYGYATAAPRSLVIWEAQFGDFANGAQVVIDQFISSGEEKWQRLCGLVVFLPHGYEGQGAEHSSARLERFLQLCANENMQVCVPTTPAQFFHMLRRQVLRHYRKPLIVMMPKSLLRHPRAVSSLDDLSSGQFHCVISDTVKSAKAVERLVFCTGKVYYQLREQQELQQVGNLLLVRIEQLYPFPDAQVKAILKTCRQTKDIVWCQEEPQNQGAWLFINPYLQQLLFAGQQLRYIGREASAAPAVGSFKLHVQQQNEITRKVFEGL